jgi:hypothetical protein
MAIYLVEAPRDMEVCIAPVFHCILEEPGTQRLDHRLDCQCHYEVAICQSKSMVITYAVKYSPDVALKINSPVAGTSKAEGLVFSRASLLIGITHVCNPGI